MQTVSFEEYNDGCENYQGICLSCGAFRDNVEPDAEEYECEECGAFEVMGLEQALLCGKIEVCD